MGDAEGFEEGNGVGATDSTTERATGAHLSSFGLIEFTRACTAAASLGES